MSNLVLKDDEARASGFCGRLRPDGSQHKVLVEEKEKRRTGFSTGCSEIRRIDYGGFVPGW